MVASTQNRLEANRSERSFLNFKGIILLNNKDKYDLVLKKAVSLYQHFNLQPCTTGSELTKAVKLPRRDYFPMLTSDEVKARVL